jgi:TM2 domain-containing membrane protein YozV
MKHRIVAALLAFFVGGLGIHRFYLEERTAGLLYLLFCWTPIPWILAVFDFIGLLLTSERSFSAKYNGLPAASAPTVEMARDKAIAIGELKKLYDNGIITAEEFEAKRQKLLNLI